MHELKVFYFKCVYMCIHEHQALVNGYTKCRRLTTPGQPVILSASTSPSNTPRFQGLMGGCCLMSDMVREGARMAPSSSHLLVLGSNAALATWEQHNSKARKLGAHSLWSGVPGRSLTARAPPPPGSLGASQQMCCMLYV